MKRITLDKIASAAKNAKIGHEACLSDEIISEEGYIIAVKILTDKAVYNQLENIHGRMTRLKSGDVIAGVLGHRRALRGYAGNVPKNLKVGDLVHILNIGGVIGKCTSYAADVGKPFKAEVLGSVLYFPHLGERVGVPAHIGLGSISECGPLENLPPIIAVIGTCMNAGKTLAACEIIHGLTRAGLKIAAGKVTGVSLQRDTLNMRDHGAIETLSFTDAGVVTTDPKTSAETTRRILSKLSQAKPDAIVLEFGDGILGEYGVQAILSERDLITKISAVVLCANDPVAAWGGVHMLKELYGIESDVICGPVTDNEVGVSYIKNHLKISAANAITTPGELVSHVKRKVFNCEK